MVTILLPVHNDERYLRFTLESILSQQFKDYKCIIGFNGTTDRSKEISDFIIGKDKRFIIEDLGSLKGKSLTLNKLLKIVDTDYISLIDGDDTWNPLKLKSQIEIRESYDVIGTLASYIDENNNKFLDLKLSECHSGISSGLLYGHNQIINSSSFFKTSDAIEVNGWDPEVEGLEDFDFWLKLNNKGKKFFNIQEYLVFHRIHKNSNFNSRNLPYTVKDIINKNKINADKIF